MTDLWLPFLVCVCVCVSVRVCVCCLWPWYSKHELWQTLSQKKGFDTTIPQIHTHTHTLFCSCSLCLPILSLFFLNCVCVCVCVSLYITLANGQQPQEPSRSWQQVVPSAHSDSWSGQMTAFTCSPSCSHDTSQPTHTNDGNTHTQKTRNKTCQWQDWFVFTHGN